MFQRKKLFVLIPALLLVPLLVGMIPLKMARKPVHGGPYAQCQDKHGCCYRNCSIQSPFSQNHLDESAAHPTLPDRELARFEKLPSSGPESSHPHTGFAAIPLRC